MKSINFIKTKQYKQFTEFCKACHKDNIIGLCYGPAGVGKTESAREYTKWYKVQPLLDHYTYVNEAEFPPIIKKLNTVIYTPSILSSAKDVFNDINQCGRSFTLLKERVLHGPNPGFEFRNRNCELTDLVIIDEAEKLKPQAFELIREMYDEGKLNFVFMGMPGIEKILERFPQLYSRIGFVHQFKKLGKTEIEFIIEKHFSKLGISISDNDFTDQEAISAIIRITSGNFRLINRLLKQSLRIMKVNCMNTLTKEIIEAARTCLLIGEK